MDPIDWQTRKTLSESTKFMLDNSVNSDVNFKVGENQEVIKAHKFILTIRSAVFDKMFNGSFCESEKDPVIPDVSPAAFNTLLRYCYYDCLDVQDDVALSVLYASTKYMLPLLEEAARKKVIQILSSSEYIWDVYKYAVNVGDTELHEACKKYFQGNVTPVKEALQAEAFLNISHNVLLDFLHINDEVEKSLLIHRNQIIKLKQESDSETNKVYYQNCIGICISEFEIFKAFNAWAEAECLRQEIKPIGANKRTVLGECLFLLRFPTMLQEDLANVVHPTGILTQDEVINLWKHKHKHKDTSSENQVNFPSSERQFLVTRPWTTESAYDTGTVSIESRERMILSRVWTEYSGSFRVTVTNNTSNRSCSKQYDALYKDLLAESINDYPLSFIDIEPQLLEAHTIYSVTAHSIQSSAGEKNMKKVTIGDQLTPFEELKLNYKSEGDAIYALTLHLV